MVTVAEDGVLTIPDSQMYMVVEIAPVVTLGRRYRPQSHLIVTYSIIQLRPIAVV
jgi:hypothetical protein